MWWQKYEKALFEERGRGPDKFDCWGLVREIYKNDHPKKIELPSFNEYYDTTTAPDDKRKIASAIQYQSDKNWIETNNPQPFDVIVLKISGYPMHVGIVIRKGIMIHCTNGIGVAIEKYNSMRWDNKIIGFFRYEQ